MLTQDNDPVPMSDSSQPPESPALGILALSPGLCGHGCVHMHAHTQGKSLKHKFKVTSS